MRSTGTPGAAYSHLVEVPYLIDSAISSMFVQRQPIGKGVSDRRLEMSGFAISSGVFDRLRPCPLLSDPLQQFRRRFVVRVLRHELAAHGEVEDGLAQLLDLVGACGEGAAARRGRSGRRPGRFRDRAR